MDETQPTVGARGANNSGSDTDSVYSQPDVAPPLINSASLNNLEAGSAEAELHDAVYVVGAADEAVTLRGQHYHPCDVEAAVLRCHKKVNFSSNKQIFVSKN